MDELSNSERLEALFREHYPAVLGYARRRAALAMADDVAAETFAVAWRRADAIPEEALPWLLGVARRVLATHRRAASRRLRLAQHLQDVECRVEGTPTVSGRIGKALAALSENDREAILLVAWEGLAIKQAAATAGLSAPAFSVRLHRARRRLRVHLERLASPSASPVELPPPRHDLRAIKGDPR